MSRNTKSHTRRTLLKTFGTSVGVLAASGVAGAKKDNSAGQNTQNEQSTGGIEVDYYGATLPGAEPPETPIRDSYRSSRPFRMESDVGGVAVARPQQKGVKLELDITKDDAFAGALINTGLWNIDKVSEIHFDATDSINILLPLGISFNEGTIGEWEPIKGNKQRGKSLDGDGRARAFGLDLDDSPITRTDRVFTLAPGGAIDNPQRGVSIEEIQKKFGNFPMGVNASVVISPSQVERGTLSREALVTDLSVVTR